MTGKDSTLSRLTFARCEEGRLQISPEALNLMYKYVQDEAEKPEAGGVLLGRHINDTSDIIVDSVTTPLEGDRQSRFRFIRARRRHQEAIDHAWKASGGTCTYLGEWHTHPELYPTPSVIDWINWQRKMLFDQFTQPMFFVIVGTTQICAWEGRRSSRPVALRLLDI